jgi:hypothetical protein
MVKKWWAIIFEYFGNEKFDGRLGRISHKQKKELSSTSEMTNIYVKQLMLIITV